MREGPPTPDERRVAERREVARDVLSERGYKEEGDWLVEWLAGARETIESIVELADDGLLGPLYTRDNCAETCAPYDENSRCAICDARALLDQAMGIENRGRSRPQQTLDEPPGH